MAEGVRASATGAIVQWLVDNFCICRGYSVPRCLMYEIYVETCGQNAQNQVNPATFGKLVRLVFPDLGTRRLGTRGSARYHYDGIYIKRSSFFYAQYCYLLEEKGHHSGDAITFEKSTDYNGIIQQEETGENLSPIKTDSVGSPASEFRRCAFWEQELAKKYSYKMVASLADEYCSYCQELLRSVGSRQLAQVEGLLTSFWRSLQQDSVLLMSLPDVCPLLRCYDIQLFKGIEDVLLHDFLDDVSIQYLKSVRLFSKKFKLWLRTALEGFPALLQISKLKEVTVFVKRLRRKTYLSNMAKTMRLVLKNNARVSALRSDLSAILSQGALDVSEEALEGQGRTEELQSRSAMRCLSCLISLLGTSTDLSVFLNCLSSNLQALVFQPSRSKEEFVELAASFQLRWNFLLTAVSKAMTLCHRDSFGSWHLFHLLLLEYATHVFQSRLEDAEEDALRAGRALLHPLDPSPAQCARPGSALPWASLRPGRHSRSPAGAGSTALRILGVLVDTATGSKIAQVLLEDKATESTLKLSLPVGREALVTLNDGQNFVIHISDVPQSPAESCFRESSANMQDDLFE